MAEVSFACPSKSLRLRFDLEDDAARIQAHHRRELPGPGGQALEGFALRLLVPRDDAQLARERPGRGHRLAFAHARGPGRAVGARNTRALRGTFGNHQGRGRNAAALGDLQGQCGQLERDPEHGAAS